MRRLQETIFIVCLASKRLSGAAEPSSRLNFQILFHTKTLINEKLQASIFSFLLRSKFCLFFFLLASDYYFFLLKLIGLSVTLFAEPVKCYVYREHIVEK